MEPAPSTLELSLRRLDPSARPGVLKHLLGLSAEDRRLRFGAAMNEDAVERYVDGIDFSADQVWCAYDQDMKPVGLCHVCPGSDGDAELALSVAIGERRRGIATHLMDTALAAARQQGWPALVAQIDRNNTAMVSLARRLGARLEPVDRQVLARFAVKKTRRAAGAGAQAW